MENELKYLNLVNKILDTGTNRDNDRTQIGTKAIFAEKLDLNLQDGFPLFTHRQIFYKGIIGELIAFLRGYTNIKDFQKLGCNYWNLFADKNGNLGPIYGAQWRNFNNINIDQLYNVLKEAKSNPQSRRLYVSAWNPGKANEMALLPCFHGFQIFVDGNYFDLLVNMRSSDVMLGLPSDIVFHALLMLVFQNSLMYTPRKLTFVLGDAHIYSNHLEYAKSITCPNNKKLYDPPKAAINKTANFDNVEPKDFNIINYQYNPPYALPINV